MTEAVDNVKRDATRQAYDEVAGQYRQGMANMAVYHEYCQTPVILDGVSDVIDKALLDLACGDGFYTRKFRSLARANPVSGSDLSPELIALAKQEEANNPLGIEYAVDDVLALRESRVFEVVTAIHLLHYMPTVEALATVLRNIYGVLEPGSRFVTFGFNPDFRIEYHDATDSEEKFGYWFSRADGQNGGLVRFHPGRIAGLTFEFYRWHRSCIEDVASAVGFAKCEWRDPFVSQAGLDKYGAGYFENHIANPQGKLLILTR